MKVGHKSYRRWRTGTPRWRGCFCQLVFSPAHAADAWTFVCRGRRSARTQSSCHLEFGILAAQFWRRSLDHRTQTDTRPGAIHCRWRDAVRFCFSKRYRDAGLHDFRRTLRDLDAVCAFRGSGKKSRRAQSRRRRASQVGRQPNDCASRNAHARDALYAKISRYEQGLGDRAGSAANAGGRRQRADADCSDVRRRLHSSHCLRERSQSAPRPRVGTAERNRDSSRAWCQPVPHRAAIAYRKRCSRWRVVC